jgi:hypothetical protein
MQHADVRQICHSLAELLTTHGTTISDLAVGERLGERVGRSPEPIARLTRERCALMQSLPPGGDDSWDCNNVRLGNEFISRMVLPGEVGGARDALERSGSNVQEMAKQVLFIEKITSATQQQQEATPAASQP